MQNMLKGVENTMQKEEYLIHEVAEEMQLEPHVLRYWEEELNLEVNRNERGHRIYTKDDVEKLTYIKFLKEQGLKLKAIKTWMNEEKNGVEHINQKVIPIQLGYEERKKENSMIEIKERKPTLKEKQEIATKMKENQNNQEEINEKIYKMQLIMQKIFSNIIIENNNNLIQEITDNVKNSVTKEFDYQMRVFLDEEDKREEKRMEENMKLVENALDKQEEHFKRIDELLRQKNNKKENSKKVLAIKRV